MRTPLIAGNWKMHLSVNQAKELTNEIVNAAEAVDGVDVLLCPSFTLLATVTEATSESKVVVGAQNLYWEEKGAYTGEISANMLVDAKCRYVIVGHSERRQYFGETDASVRRRTLAALESGLTPIVCVGETLEEREEGSTSLVIERQISGALERFKNEDVAKLVIAYEPVWAIGTGRTATPEVAQDVHKMIRKWIAEHFSQEVADSLRILYGGSMKPDNAAILVSQPDIDGGLVGGASLDAQSFSEIIKASR